MTNTKITVCAECLRACCWKGIFMCDASRDADITTRTVAELKELDREHSNYWDGTYERAFEERRAR
jgi:hypothetical protein